MALAQCVAHLQQSHVLVAQSRMDVAKKECLLASKIINEALASRRKDVKPLAEFTLDFYRRLVCGADVLPFLEKLRWLNTSVFGFACYPTLAFGETSSSDYAPLEVNEPEISVPDLDVAIELRAAHVQPSLDDIAHLTDLYQDLLPNCSFVLSLLSIAEAGFGEHLRGLVKLFGENAKVTLNFNGGPRELILTTKLPFVRPPHDKRSIIVRSASDPDLLWPALIEKAYLVAMGEQYNFSGSNMAQDTYMLIGWLPEVRKVSQCGLDAMSELWKLREQGLVTLGLGTGPLSPQLALELGVIPEHDYVLCDYNAEEHIFRLKNPWVTKSEGENKSGRFLDVGLSLWGQFSYVYINRKPEFMESVSSSFICAPSETPEVFLANKPQFPIINTTSEPQNVSVLVEQYISGKLPRAESTSFCVAIYEGTSNVVPISTLHACVSGGRFSNSRLQLVKFTLEPRREYVVVVTQAQSDVSKVYSISVNHNMEKFELARAKKKYPQMCSPIEGTWSVGYNGGSWATEGYIHNPQYDLEVLEGTRNMELLLITENSQADVNVHVFHSDKSEKGKKIRNFDKSKLLFNDKYTPTLHHKELRDLEPGSYKVVVSAYERKHADDFRLLVSNDGSTPVSLDRIPQALGTFTESLTFLWNLRNRHKVTLRPEHNMCQIVLHVQAGETGSQNISNYRPAMRASVFDGFTSEPVVICSKWNESVYGVFVECVLPRAENEYILLVERFESGDGLCRISVGSSCRVVLSQSSQ